MGAGRATAIDGRTVQVQAPTAPGERVGFIAQIEELPLETMVPAAKVVINARTGSVVLNQAVTLGPCAVAHGNLSIIINALGATPGDLLAILQAIKAAGALNAELEVI